MRYLGGKEKISKQICVFLESIRLSNQIFIDLTVGGASIISRMSDPKVGFDINTALISLYKVLSHEEYLLPDNVTEEMYNEAKTYSDENPLKAFILFGCSFSGKYMGGYARSREGRNYALNAKNSLQKKFRTLKKTEFYSDSLFNLTFKKALIYIDPPYANTTKYHKIEFDYDSFWNKVRELSKDNTVIVSEYCAPEDFECVLEIKRKLEMHTNNDNVRIEKLFKLKD